jgi:hypothetical protein
MGQELQQVETKGPGRPGEPVGWAAKHLQRVADEGQTGLAGNGDEDDVDPDDPDAGRRGD